MKSKIIGQVLFILFFMTAASYAQETANVNDIIAEMEKEFNLTPQQLAPVKLIIKEDMDKREEFRRSVENQTMIIDSDSIRRKIEQLDQDENKKLGQILTQEQMNKWIQKQQLKNSFNKDRMDNTRWNAQEDRRSLGINF